MSKKSTKIVAKHKPKTTILRVLAVFGAAVLIVCLGLVAWFWSIRAPNLPEPSLKVLAAQHGVQLGMLAQPEQLTEPAFGGVLTSQYSMITSDGQIHWDKFRPSPTAYDFAPMDKEVAFAQAHNMTVQGHHLVWDEEDSLPKWLKSSDYSHEQLMDILHEHIATTVGRYKGRVTEWSVVNEPFSRMQHVFGLKAWWAENLGNNTEYIDQAFRWARQADPDAKLILNDFYNEAESPVSNAMYEYMKSAKARGVPIDGIGLQMHVDLAHPPNKDAIVRNMQRFGKLGYKVYMTEFDFRYNTTNKKIEERTMLETRLARDVVHACVEAGNCVSLTVFGMADQNSFARWLTHGRYRSYLFTSRYQPKPAFDAFRKAWTK